MSACQYLGIVITLGVIAIGIVEWFNERADRKIDETLPDSREWFV